MNKLQLANGISLSKIILGTADFGTGISEEASFRLMDMYLSGGGNTFDTARAYCGWIKGSEFASESTLGKWIKQRGNREDVVVITKGAHPPFDGSEPYNRLSADCINHDIEVSLDTLQMDYVDLYFLHRDDENRPVSEIIDTLNKLIQSGKIKAIGASNWKLSRIIEANEYARKTGQTGFSASQIQWSYAKCTPATFGDNSLICMDDKSYKDYLAAKIPILAYSSQAGGVFSMGYKPDLSDILPKHTKYLSDENKARYTKLVELCEDKNYSCGDVCLSYICDNILPACAIAGCSTEKQLNAILNSQNLHLCEKEIEYLR